MVNEEEESIGGNDDGDCSSAGHSGAMGIVIGTSERVWKRERG